MPYRAGKFSRRPPSGLSLPQPQRNLSRPGRRRSIVFAFAAGEVAGVREVHGLHLEVHPSVDAFCVAALAGALSIALHGRSLFSYRIRRSIVVWYSQPRQYVFSHGSRVPHTFPWVCALAHSYKNAAGWVWGRHHLHFSKTTFNPCLPPACTPLRYNPPARLPTGRRVGQFLRRSMY